MRIRVSPPDIALVQIWLHSRDVKGFCGLVLEVHHSWSTMTITCMLHVEPGLRPDAKYMYIRRGSTREDAKDVLSPHAFPKLRTMNSAPPHPQPPARPHVSPVER